MNYSFEYIDIILLAMIAGFIFLRLRGILGKRTGFEGKGPSQLKEVLKSVNQVKPKKINENFDEEAKKEFLKGAKIAYETIITNFAKGKINEIKTLLDKKVLDQFEDALKEREKNGYKSETTFIGINSAEITKHEKKDNNLEVTVNFVSEIISCIKDKNSKILSGNPDKIKKVYDTWRFSKNLKSLDPNWTLVETNI